jgi:hypothetical protein
MQNSRKHPDSVFLNNVSHYKHLCLMIRTSDTWTTHQWLHRWLQVREMMCVSIHQYLMPFRQIVLAGVVGPVGTPGYSSVSQKPQDSKTFRIDFVSMMCIHECMHVATRKERIHTTFIIRSSETWRWMYHATTQNVYSIFSQCHT